MENTCAIEKTTVECYKLRITGGNRTWADITVDSNDNAGRIQIASDYGSWENYWGACGSSFKQFLIDLTKDIHYTANKFGEARWFDQEATMTGLKSAVEECDEDEEFKELLREELKALDDCTEVNSFFHIAYESDNLYKLWDTGPDIQYGINPAFEAFWEKVWPFFVEELKKELSTENPA